MDYTRAKNFVLVPPKLMNVSQEQNENISISSVFDRDGSPILLTSDPRTILEIPSIMQNGSYKIELNWEFDVVHFAERADVGNLPLVVISNYIIRSMGLDVRLDLNMYRVNNWLRCVEDSYNDNPYHNHLHGADVMGNIYHWCTSKLFSQNMSPLDLLTTLMAAASHDVGHDAVNNQYHILTRSILGTRYNDASPLENHHASLSSKLLYMPDNNWIYSMELEAQRYVRSLMIELILATDFNYHKHHKSNLMAFADIVELPKSVEDDTITLRALKIGETEKKEEQQSRVNNERCEKIMVLKAGLHIADIANPTKPLNICVYWAKKITQEFYEQGDKERARGLTVSPLMDRKTSKIADGQKGFIKFVVRPIFELWAKIVPESKIALVHIAKNLVFWENYIDESKVEKLKQVN